MFENKLLKIENILENTSEELLGKIKSKTIKDKIAKPMKYQLECDFSETIIKHHP